MEMNWESKTHQRAQALENNPNRSENPERVRCQDVELQTATITKSNSQHRPAPSPTGSGRPPSTAAAFPKARQILSDEKCVSQSPESLCIIKTDLRAIQIWALSDKDVQITMSNKVKKVDDRIDNFTRELESPCQRTTWKL